MPKLLQDSQLPKLKHGEGPSKVYDGHGTGLFVHLTKTKHGTSRHFKHDYVFSGKRKQISYGKYPDIGLSQARDLHREARALLADGKDPVQVRRNQRREEAAKQRTLNTAFTEFLDTRQWSKAHAQKERLRWNKHVSPSQEKVEERRKKGETPVPAIGHLPLGSVEKDDIRKLVKHMEVDSVDTAQRVFSLIDQVFRCRKF